MEAGMQRVNLQRIPVPLGQKRKLRGVKGTKGDKGVRRGLRSKPSGSIVWETGVKAEGLEEGKA